MISVKEARHIILQNIQDFGTETIPFVEATGRILKEDVVADRDFPPFNRVAMDGIAINYQFFKQGIRDFKIEGIQPAGSQQKTMVNIENCYEVMTGAVLPNNCDTVIRYEDVEISNNKATILIDKITKGQNIHIQGSDKAKGALLIPKNAVISAAEIGVIATVGKSKITVAKQPKVIVISTGDELVNVASVPAAHQIRRSNVHTLVSLLEQLKISCNNRHIVDNETILKNTIEQYLQHYDVLLFSGAVSKGKFDFLPKVLEELGVEKQFHKVAQRPGKPFWFGQTKNCKVFAFPGNPISTFVNCLAYFYPWYYQSVGLKRSEQTAILKEEVTFKPNLTCFLQVKLENENGSLLATPIQTNGSGDLASLVKADGFIELPQAEKIKFEKGTVYTVITYR
ncbi:molybdopterin molybdotransferase MoeA [Tenacibaculum sp. UWU-22]|uniref:molybdopterin molybdotransferase MoeA n=1 Tax=Tenacibaculum sp. UWU-22 TaxID=3234187 RepID=UPI0034DB5BE8